MSELILPNSFANGTKPEAAPHQENFETIEDFVNAELLHADGNIAMTGPLRIPNPKNDHDLVNKQYADGRGTPSSTTDTICRRNSIGTFGIGASLPTLDAHAATRAYIDGPMSGYSSGWTTLTLLNGASTTSGGVSLRCRKFDGVVHLVGRVNFGTAPKHIATLPSGFRPPGTIHLYGGVTGDMVTATWLRAQSNGQIHVDFQPEGDYDPNIGINALFPAA